MYIKKKILPSFTNINSRIYYKNFLKGHIIGCLILNFISSSLTILGPFLITLVLNYISNEDKELSEGIVIVCAIILN